MGKNANVKHKTQDTRPKTQDFHVSCLISRVSRLMSCVLLLLLALSSLTRQSQALEILSFQRSEAKGTPKVRAKAKFSFGYDNNVSERREDKVESRFYQFYISSGMYILPSERTLLSLKLQDGLKHLDAPSLSGESVLINGLSLCLSHRLSEKLVPEIQSEIRGRTSIHSESGVSPSEEAYLRGFVGMALRVMVLSDVTGKAFYHYRFINFEDFDPFDRRGPRIGLRADVRLLPGATIGLQYSREEARFNKWNLVFPDRETSRVDVMNDISLCAQFYKYFLFDITYSHQNNSSDSDGYSYRVNRFTLLLARSLPRDFMFQLYALIRSKKFRSASSEPISTQKEREHPARIKVDLEDDDRGMLTVKLSKDISEDCALEAQYDLRRSSSYEEDGLYTKSVFSFSLSSHF